MALAQLDILNELINVERLKNVALVGYVVSEASMQGVLRDSVEVDSSCKFVNVKIFYLQDQYKKGYKVDGVITVGVKAEVKVGEFYAFRGTLSAVSKEYTRDVTLFKFAKEGSVWVVKPVDSYDLSKTRFLKDEAVSYLEEMKKNPLTRSSSGMFDTNVPNIPMIKSFLGLLEYGSLIDVVGTKEVKGEKLTPLQEKLLGELSGQSILQVYVEESPLLGVEDVASYMKASYDDCICYNFVGKGVRFDRIMTKLETNGILGSKSNIVVFTDEESLDRKYAYIKIKRGGLM
jgi:hypothetical protein